MDFEFKRYDYFGSLKNADVFTYEDEVYMKIEETPNADNQEIIYNCVSLEFGTLYAFEDNFRIHKCKAKMVLE